MSRPPKLSLRQAAYVRKAVRLRKALTNAAIARRLRVGKTTVTVYASQRHKSDGYRRAREMST